MDDPAVSFVHGFMPSGSMSIANVGGLYAELHNDTARRSFVHWASKSLVFLHVPVDLCACGFPFRKRLTLFSVSAPVHLKLARRCDIFHHVCSFFWQIASKLEGIFYSSLVARVLVHSFHAKNSWTNKHRWLGCITARGTDGVEVGCSAR